MNIVDSFDDDEDSDDDYCGDSGAIPSNAVITAEADVPAITQRRAFAVATFSGRDIALLSLSSSSSSKLCSSNDETLLSWSSHCYDSEEREGESDEASESDRESECESESNCEEALKKMYPVGGGQTGEEDGSEEGSGDG